MEFTTKSAQENFLVRRVYQSAKFTFFEKLEKTKYNYIKYVTKIKKSQQNHFSKPF